MWLGLTTLLVLPLKAHAQVMPPGAVCGEEVFGCIKLVGTCLKAQIYEDDNSVSFFFVQLCAPIVDVPCAGAIHDVYLGTTAIGAFSFSLDLAATLTRAGPGISLNWFPYEGIQWSLRADLLRGTLSAWTLSEP
jgi:hypothetical protein